MGTGEDAPQAVVTGVGWLAAEPFAQAMDGGPIVAPEETPEITGFETPEGAPAFGFELIDFQIEDYLPNLKTYVDRTSALALAAAKLALIDAGLLVRDDESERGHPGRTPCGTDVVTDTKRQTGTSAPHRQTGTSAPPSGAGWKPAVLPAGVEIGCSYATTFGCLEAMGIFWKKVKRSNPKFAPPLPFTHGYANSPSSLVCIEYGLKGSAATFSGQETSGIEALLFAVDQIATGAAQIVLVCASESLTQPVHAHLHAEKRLSASGRQGLWAPVNDGVVPGEGAACWIVENAASAKARGRKPLAQLAAVGLASGKNGLNNAIAQLGDIDGRTLIYATTPDARSVDEAESTALKAQAFANRASVVAPKLLSGELFSVSPLLAGILAMRVGTATEGLKPLSSAASTEPFQATLLLSRDPNGSAGACLVVSG